MIDITERPVQCPYCGEWVTIVVDGSVSEQRYVEDCFVCCRPMHLLVLVDDESGAEVVAAREDDV